MLPPGGRNWQLISPHLTVRFEKLYLLCFAKFWNNIKSYLVTSGGQSYKCCLFFQRQSKISKLEICGSLRQLFSCIGV